MTARLMTVDQAAAELGISSYQVRQEYERGVLPGRRPGRFLRFTDEDIDTYIARIGDDKGSAQSGHTRRRRTA